MEDLKQQLLGHEMLRMIKASIDASTSTDFETLRAMSYQHFNRLMGEEDLSTAVPVCVTHFVEDVFDGDRTGSLTNFDLEECEGILAQYDVLLTATGTPVPSFQDQGAVDEPEDEESSGGSMSQDEMELLTQ